MSQQVALYGGQTPATCCAQQRCDMLRGNAAIVWPGLSKYKDNDRVALASGNT